MMTAIYKASKNCASCIDLGWLPEDGSACVECDKLNTHKVKVLELGVGFLGNRAVVQNLKSNELFTVYISELKKCSRRG